MNNINLWEFESYSNISVDTDYGNDGTTVYFKYDENGDLTFLGSYPEEPEFIEEKEFMV